MTQQIIAMASPRTQRVCDGRLVDLHGQLTPFYSDIRCACEAKHDLTILRAAAPR